MTTGNPFVSNLSHEPFNEACKTDDARTARLNELHSYNKKETAREIAERLGMTAEQVKMLIELEEAH